MIRRPPRSTRVRSSAASDVYKRQVQDPYNGNPNNLSSVNGGPVSLGDAYTVPISVYNLVTGPISPFAVSIDGLTFTMTGEVVTSQQDGNIGLAFVGTLTADTNNELALI